MSRPRMRWWARGFALAVAAAGCAQQPSQPQTAGKISTVGPGKPTPQVAANVRPTTAKPTPKPVGGEHVVEVITKPVLVQRPNRSATTRGAAGSGAGSSATVTRPPIPSGPVAPAAPMPKLTLAELQKIDTAVTTAPLLRLLAMKLNHIPYQQFAGFGAIDFTPNLPENADPDTATADVLARDPAGTAVALRHLISGKVDMVVAPRQPSPAEVSAASAAGVQLRADFIATEALVFTVNLQNPVQGLTKDQLTGIFGGKFKTWKELGPKTVPAASDLADAPLTVAYRARGTGSEELMQQILLAGQPMPELPVSKALSTDKLVLDAAAEDPETIGFSVFCYVTNMKADARIRVLPIDGITPEPANIASGSYPLTTPVYVITRTDLPATSDLYNLRTWLGNLGGQRVLAEAGYMPMINEAWTSGRLK